MSNSFKRTILLLAGAFFFQFSDAQSDTVKNVVNDPVVHRITQEVRRANVISFNSELEVGSNVFNRELMLQGVNDKVIDDNFGRVAIFSRAGIWSNSVMEHIGYSYALNRDSLFLKGGISSAVSGSAGVTEPFMKIAMRGNAQYGGESVNLGGSEFLYQSFDRFTLGLVGINKSGLYWGLNVHGIGGKEFYNVYFREAYISISEFGDTISGPVRANWDYTDANKRYSGWGLGVDFKVMGELPSGLNFEIKLADVGFVSWNNAILNEIDDSLAFDGFNYSLSTDRASGVNFADSFAGDYVTERRGSVVASLPTRFSVRVTNMIVPKHFLSLSLGTINIPGYTPLLEVEHRWSKSDRFRLMSTIGYGGFGQLRWREQVRLTNKSNRLVVLLGIMGIESLSYNKMAMNAGGNFGLRYYW